MACEVLCVPGGVFALWGKPALDDMEHVVSAIEAAARECGHPVIYVTRVPAQAPAPDSATRAHIDSLMPRLREATSTYHVVLEGEGFGAAMKRGVLTSIFQLSWRRKPFFVHATVSEVLRKVPPEAQKAASALLSAAADRGLLTTTL